MGSKNVKKESVKYHTLSASHENAVKAKLAKEKEDRHEPSSLELGFQRMDSNTIEKMEKLFRSAFYLVIKERPYSDFPDVLELQALNGVEIGETYRNEKAGKEFVSQIGGVYHDNLKELLRNADYFSVYCDGSTNRTESEKEIVMVRVLEDFYPKVKYLKIVEPPNTKASGILQAINGTFQDFGFTSVRYKKKIVGFGSDGASVMMGVRQGVISLLKEEGDVPWVLAVWRLLIGLN